MSDILDVLNIKSFPQKKAEKDQQQPQHNIFEQKQHYTAEEYASANKRRKLSAMNRELYNLIGPNVPSLAIDTASVSNSGGGKKFKEKLISAKKDAPWRHLGFKNSARDDDLVLHHWTKAKPLETLTTSVEGNTNTAEENPKETTENDAENSDDKREVQEALDPNEYRYVKYNTKLNIPTFTEEEYHEAIRFEEEKRKKDLEIKIAKEKIKQEKEELLQKKSETVDAGTPSNLSGSKDNEKNSAKISEAVDTKQVEQTDKDELKKNDTVANATSSKESTDIENSRGATSLTPVQQNEKLEGDVTSEAPEEPKEREWTFEETKFLFDLCGFFDMRWAVIYDSYVDKYPDRSLEDLKVQIYTISANLLEKKGNPNDSALIKALRTFNKEKEISRKYYLTKLIHRAPTEIAEEESLVIEARKFELAAKKMLYERGQLLQLLDSPQSSASVQQYLTSQGLTQLYNSLMASDKSKKRKAEVPVAPLLGPNAIPHTQHLMMSTSSSNHHNNNNYTHHHNSTNNSSNTGNSANGTKRRQNTNTGGSSGKSSAPANNVNPVSKTTSKLSEVQQLLQKSLTTEEMEVYGIEIHNERIQPGVHVRSQKIASFKPSVQAKVHEILGQLGLSIKPTMPTGPVSKKFDELLYKLSHLVDLKKQSDKLVAEIELIKRQKGV